jgi:hypothetical protein
MGQMLMTKAALLEVLRVARAQWDAAIAESDPASMTEPGVAGEWSVKDIIAHVAWFEREMVRMLRDRALVGSDLWQWPADERNAAIFELNRQRELPDVLSDASEVYQQLLNALEPLTDEDLNDARRFREMPADWQPWRILAQNSYEHYEHHLDDIRKGQKSRAEKG